MTRATPTALQSRLTRSYPKLEIAVNKRHATITLAEDTDLEGKVADALIVRFRSPAGEFTEAIPRDVTVPEAVALLRRYADDLQHDTLTIR